MRELSRHILQSDMWGEFKNSIGTPAIQAAGVLFTKHKIPFTSYTYAYSPRVDPFAIDFDNLKKVLEENDCIAIHFDVPNIVKGSEREKTAVELLQKYCRPSIREEFAKANIFLDLTKSEEQLLSEMTSKQRYNINYAQKKGVTVRLAETEEDFNKFYALYEETGTRQSFFNRSKKYMKGVWETFRAHGCCDILIAEYQGKPLSSWLLLTYENTLYYPYGGSTEELKNLQANCLIGWEAIKYGKSHGCTLFDMWGASEDLADEKDPYYGFTQFKYKFGGKHVVYIPSFDFVLNEGVYKLFSIANNLRWKVLNLIR